MRFTFFINLCNRGLPRLLVPHIGLAPLLLRCFGTQRP
nr:MAG TPA: hypothetical protein [Caudoviricetes sp.]